MGKKTERTLKKESVENCSNAVYLLVAVFWLTVALRLIVICKNPTCPNHSNFRVKPETSNKKQTDKENSRKMEGNKKMAQGKGKRARRIQKGRIQKKKKERK